jgi:hypothetical protein
MISGSAKLAIKFSTKSSLPSAVRILASLGALAYLPVDCGIHLVGLDESRFGGYRVPPGYRIPEKADSFGFEFKNVTPSNKTQSNREQSRLR